MDLLKASPPQWLWVALALPVALAVAGILRLIWVPVMGTVFSPFTRWLGPNFDVVKLQPYVLLGSFLACTAGWLVFAVFLRR